MKFTKIALTLMCSTILFCGCAKNSDVVLKINDKSITRAEFYDDFNKIKNVRLNNAPKEYQADNSLAVLTLKENYTNDVIIRELLSEEFAKRNIQASEDEIKAKKAQVIAQIGSEEQFNNILKENNITEERLKSDMASEVKMDKLFNSLSKQKVTDADAEKFYKANKAQFETPESVLASHILIDTNAENIKRKITDADKDAKLSTADIDAKVKAEVERKEKLVRDIRNQLVKNPKKFADLAKQYSEDEATAQKGGDLGFIYKEMMVKEFADAAFSQKVGTISPVVKTQFGEHIILVRDKAAKGIRPFSSVKEDLKKYLAQQNKVEAMQKLIAGLKESAKIEYVDPTLNPENLKKEKEKALAKQTEHEKNLRTPKSKKKLLEKTQKEDK